jgi:hypothetical protein
MPFGSKARTVAPASMRSGTNTSAGESRTEERIQILGEAGSPEARSRVQEFGADAIIIEAHAAGDVLNVGAGLLANVGHLVDEGDLVARNAFDAMFV